MKSWSSLVAWFALAVFGVSGLQAAEPEQNSGSLGSDQYVFGGSVRIDEPVAGDLLAVGGNVDVEARVGGDTVIAGGNLRISAPVGGSVFGGGGRLVIDAPVARNVRVGGGQVDLNPKAVVAGNVTVGGGQVSLRGEVKGSVTIGGGRVMIDGPVGGDVESAAGRLRLGPNARIAGKLRYRSGNELDRDPAAQVGSIEQVTRMPGDGADARSGDRVEEPRRHGAGLGWLWTLGMMVLAVVLAAAMPLTSQRVATNWRTRFGPSVLWGFIVLVCVPVAALILAITVIGIPIALVGLLLYGATLLVGYVASGMAVGLWALQRWRAEAIDRRPWRLGFAALGVLVVGLLGSVPFVGALVALLAVVAGVGALVQLMRAPPATAA